MLIGFDASRLRVRQRTGTEQYTWELLAALGGIDHYHHYRLYSNGPPPVLPPLPPRFQLRSLRLPRLWTHARLSAEMLLHPPDVLFVPAHVLPVWSPRHSVVTIHDLGYLHYPEAHPPAHRLYLRLSTRWNALGATHVVAVSEATRRDLISYCRTPAAKISVVYHGVSDRFRPIDDHHIPGEILRRYGVSIPYLLFVGTVQPRKNLQRLIEAWAMYLRRASSTAPMLVIAGKRGWLTEGIERRAHELGVADHVRFIGYVADEDLPALIGGALGYLFPSLYEGFGLPVLEAQACGTPVLTSTVASLPEVAGDAAIFVDPHDTTSIAQGIERLVEDVDLRQTLREKGLSRVGEWTWQRTARETLAVLEAVGPKA